MGENDIAEEVKQFIVEKIDSFGELESLLLLAKDPARPWTAPEVSAELRSGAAAARHLETLARKGLVAEVEDRAGAYRYSPATPEIQTVVSMLLTAYVTYQLRIINLIYGKADQKLRAFSNAFLIGKKDDEDG